MHSDGTSRWVRLETTLSHDIDGAQVCRVTTSDITERKGTEDSLRQFKTFFDTANFGAAMTNLSGVATYVNDCFATAHGYKVDELLGRSLSCLHTAEQQAPAEELLRQLVRKGTFEAQEIGHCRRDGTPFPMLVTGVVVCDANGAPQCLAVAANDMTGLKAVEATVQQAQKMAAIGTLAGGIAHDFNNIFTGILGGLSLMEIELGNAGLPDAEVREIKAFVERGAALTKQLLGFARRGKHDVAPTDLARVIEKTSALFGRTRKDIAIHMQVAPGLRAILMDRAQLEQVLLNLLTNAGHAMPHGGSIRLRAENREATKQRSQVEPDSTSGNHFVRLVIADTGIGMDAATQARIFEPFFTTKAPGSGTGLGLASVYGIIHRHAGSIEVCSAPGRGARFTLDLPATDRLAVEPAVSAVPVERGTETILVVEKEDQVLGLHARILKTLGYEVLTARGTGEAIELVGQQGARISLVILDWSMLGKTARATCDALRAHAPGIKVLLSSCGIDRPVQELLARGCHGFLQKPFDAGALSAKLRELLS